MTVEPTDARHDVAGPHHRLGGCGVRTASRVAHPKAPSFCHAPCGPGWGDDAGCEQTLRGARRVRRAPTRRTISGGRPTLTGPRTARPGRMYGRDDTQP